jgi:hypothetical protein
MAGSKKKPVIIESELNRYDQKIQEFQEYLTDNKLKDIKETEKRHDEIRIQVMMMKELGPMLQVLRDLRETLGSKEEEIAKNVMGDANLSMSDLGMI